jgi:receptor protein-tyrosine kinase
MQDRGLKQATVTKEQFDSLAPEDSLPKWGSGDFCLAVGTEESTVPAQSRVVVYSDKASAGAARFRLAHMRLKSLQATRNLKSLIVTSPLPGDGKTTVALNLATVLSENGKVPVLLLEADVYRPKILERLDLKPWAGLSDCFTRNEDPMLAIRRINPLGFYLLPAGSPLEVGGEVLQSNLVVQFIKGLSSSLFGWILIDSPPTTPAAEILALKSLADATLLVARAGKTPREAIEESIQHMGRDHVLGIILNGIEGLDQAYYKYYKYGKSKTPAKPPKPTSVQGLGLNERAR